MTRCILVEDLAREINPDAFRTYPTDHYTRAAARQAAREAAERVLKYVDTEIKQLRSELEAVKAERDEFAGYLPT